MTPYFYNFELDRVVDGDSVHGEIDLGFGFKYEVPVRLSLFDAAEVRRPASKEEIAAGKRVTKFLRELIKGKKLQIHSQKKLAVYCRAEGEIYIVGDPVSVNKQVMAFIAENQLEKSRFR